MKAMPLQSHFQNGTFAFVDALGTLFSYNSFSQRGTVQFERYRSHRGESFNLIKWVLSVGAILVFDLLI